jgi:hypothetical protein
LKLRDFDMALQSFSSARDCLVAILDATNRSEKGYERAAKELCQVELAQEHCRQAMHSVRHEFPIPESEQSYHIGHAGMHRRRSGGESEHSQDESDQLEYEKDLNNAKAKQRQSIFGKMGKLRRMFGFGFPETATDRTALYSAGAGCQYGLLDS